MLLHDLFFVFRWMSVVFFNLCRLITLCVKMKAFLFGLDHIKHVIWVCVCVCVCVCVILVEICPYRPASTHLTMWCSRSLAFDIYRSIHTFTFSLNIFANVIEHLQIFFTCLISDYKHCEYTFADSCMHSQISAWFFFTNSRICLHTHRLRYSVTYPWSIWNVGLECPQKLALHVCNCNMCMKGRGHANRWILQFLFCPPVISGLNWPQNTKTNFMSSCSFFT